MPLQATSGAASYDAFGGGVAAVPAFVEEVFGTYLYTGNDTVQTITNGIDLSTKGGAVFIKSRNLTSPTVVYDTNRGINKALCTNLTNAENVGTLGTNQDLNAFNTNGFAVNLFTNAGGGFGINNSAHNLASWTFRKQPKFFDIVTWTGSNDSGTSIGQGIVPHNLGSAPGCVIIKNVTQSATNWIVYHRSLSGGYRMLLNTTDAQTNSSPTSYFAKYVSGVGWTQTDPDANNIYVGNNYQTNGNTDTLVAYLFAHDAGGFGLTGTDNVISCGSYTTDGSGNATVNLGYEPQWLLRKRSDSVSDWIIVDNMRGWATGNTNTLAANESSQEYGGGFANQITSTGFSVTSDGASRGYIYMAIRRGPMKVPTVGTSVFGMSARSGTGADATVTGGQTDDAVLVKNRGSAVASLFSSRLTSTKYLVTSSTAAEVAAGATILQANPWDVMDGVKVGTTSTITNASANTYINYLFKRAPSFFDKVCYTGNSVQGRTITHNLGVKPELMFVKSRSNAISWQVYSATETATKYMLLDSSQSSNTASFDWNDTEPTSSVFTVQGTGGTGLEVNWTGYTYVAYLFATCAGVSKCFSYTGNGSSQTINCGFTGGARFVLIKRTDSTGDWYVWDSARGIVSGNDPHLSLNSTAAEVTTDDTIDTDSTGFVVNQVSATNVNVSSATYIGLAIA